MYSYMYTALYSTLPICFHAECFFFLFSPEKRHDKKKKKKKNDKMIREWEKFIAWVGGENPDILCT